VVLDRILAQLELNGVGYNLDREAAMEGRMMSMIVSPSKSAPKKENQ
jgi:translation initiation factor IF-3